MKKITVIQDLSSFRVNAYLKMNRTSYMRGDDIPAGIQLAETFLSAAIQDMEKARTSQIDGVHFERSFKLLL